MDIGKISALACHCESCDVSASLGMGFPIYAFCPHASPPTNGIPANLILTYSPNHQPHVPTYEQTPETHRNLKQIIQTLRLRLGLLPTSTPNINPMPPHQNSPRLGKLLHRTRHPVRQILFVACVLDDGDFEGRVV